MDTDNAGQQAADVDRSGENGGEDASAARSGGLAERDGGAALEASAPSASSARHAPISQMPPPRQDISDARTSFGGNDGLRDTRNKRGMISEMKRINALNLEPTPPKGDDGSRNSKNHFKEPQAARSTCKQEFIQSLDKIQKQTAAKQSKQQDAASAASQNPDQGTGGSDQSAAGSTLPMQQRKAGAMQGQQQQMQGGGYPSQQMASNTPGGRFPFNAAAKEFSMSPTAHEFVPGGSSATGAGNTAPQRPQGPKPQGSAPDFNIQQNTRCRTSLGQILDPFFKAALEDDTGGAEPDWPDAQGQSYRNILGQPQPGRTQIAQGMPMQPGPNGPWVPQPGPGQVQPDQQHQMQAMGPGPQVAPQPQMMQGGCPGYVITAPQNMGPGGQPGPPVYHQMFVPAPGQSAQPGQPGQGQPGGQQQIQQQGQVGSGGSMPQQQQQQVDFNQRGALPQQPGQPTMMHVQMVPQQGMQNPGGCGAVGNMQAMPKFPGPGGNQMMMMPMMMPGHPGQQGGFMNQGFIPQGAPMQQLPQQGGGGSQNSPGVPNSGLQQGMMQQHGYQRQPGTG